MALIKNELKIELEKYRRKSPPQQEENIKILKRRNVFLKGYLRDNEWTLNRPLKRNFAFNESKVSKLVTGLIGHYYIVEMEWPTSNGINVILFNGQNLFLLIKIIKNGDFKSINANGEMKNQFLKYCNGWTTLFSSFVSIPAIYTGNVFSFKLDDKWREIDIIEDDKVISDSEEEIDLEKLGEDIVIPEEDLSVPETKRFSLIRRHNVFAEFLGGVGLNNSILRRKTDLRKSVIDFKSSIYFYLKRLGYCFVWAVDFNTLNGEDEDTIDVIMANIEEKKIGILMVDETDENVMKKGKKLIGMAERNSVTLEMIIYNGKEILKLAQNDWKRVK